MKVCAALMGLAAGLVVAMSSASASVRIAHDNGGRIDHYLQKFAMVRESGEQVVIDGPCLSACTLVLSAVPRDRICVTRKAMLGFHAAWHFGEGGAPVRSAGGTRFLWEAYPAHVRSWLNRKGGLKSRMVYLHGRELASMYQACR